MNKSEPRRILGDELSKPYDSEVALICDCTYFDSMGTFGHIVDRYIACTEGYQ